MQGYYIMNFFFVIALKLKSDFSITILELRITLKFICSCNCFAAVSICPFTKCSQIIQKRFLFIICLLTIHFHSTSQPLDNTICFACVDYFNSFNNTNQNTHRIQIFHTSDTNCREIINNFI